MGVLWVKMVGGGGETDLCFRTMRMFERDAAWLMGWCDGFYAWMIVIHNYASLPCFFLSSRIDMDHHNQDLSGVAVETQNASQNLILNLTKECLNILKHLSLKVSDLKQKKLLLRTKGQSYQPNKLSIQHYKYET